MDHAADGEGAAGAVVRWGVESVVGEPPRVEPEGGEIAGGFGEVAVGAAAESDLKARVAELAELDALVGGLAEDFGRDELIFGRAVKLGGRKRGVFAGLEAGLSVEAALEPRVVGGFDEGVGFRIFEPAVAGFSIEPAGEFARRVIVGHREALPRSVEGGGR